MPNIYGKERPSKMKKAKKAASKKRRPSATMLGTGGAGKAARALAGRKAKIKRALKGKKK